MSEQDILTLAMLVNEVIDEYPDNAREIGALETFMCIMGYRSWKKEELE
jgi:hypothetical protein